MIPAALLKVVLPAAIAIGLAAGIYYKGHGDGTDEERARILAEIEKARKERTRVEGDTSRLPDDDLFDRLRKPPR